MKEFMVRTKRLLPLAGGSIAIAAAAAAIGLSGAQAGDTATTPSSTPIKHVVVIFNENESFDHYFGTYPNAANVPGEPRFDAKADTPSINGLNQTLLTANPNAANPRRLDRSEAVTCSQNHGYSAEEAAFDHGLMDKFVENTAGGSCADKSIVMDYYDGNTVTGLWNLAQGFAMNDNSFSTQFGPSTVGAVNLISGNTHGVVAGTNDGKSIENNTIIGDPDPSTAVTDDCANGSAILADRTNNAGGNVGDLMNAHHVTWGWFQGGFRPTATTGGKASCGAAHVNVGGATVTDYSPHHNPFAYYRSTANPHHLPPSSVDKIGLTDQANHNYDLLDFDAALQNGNLPQVSFLKGAQFEDGHPGYSDPLDEQRFVARAVDAIESSPEWSSTAIVIAYDDSDGWYDHVMSPILNPSAAKADALSGTGACGTVKDASAYPDRCGYGPRQPLLVISPYARQNYVDSTLTDQTSILRFIEDNWQLGRIGDQSMDVKAGTLGNMFNFDPGAKPAPKVFLDPTTGQVVKKAPKVAVSPDGTPTSGYGDDDAAAPAAGKVDAAAADQQLAAAAPRTPAITAAPNVAGASAPVKARPVTVSCSTSGKGRTVKVACSAKGSDLAKVTALRFRILRGKAILATTSTRLHGTKAKATLKTRKALRKGRYTLRVTVARSGVLTATTTSVRLG